MQKPSINVFTENVDELPITTKQDVIKKNSNVNVTLERSNNICNSQNQHRYSLIAAIDEDIENVTARTDDSCCAKIEENEYFRGGDANNVDYSELNDGDDAGNKPLLLTHPHLHTNQSHHHHHHHFHQRHRNHSTSGFT